MVAFALWCLEEGKEVKGKAVGAKSTTRRCLNSHSSEREVVMVAVLRAAMDATAVGSSVATQEGNSGADATRAWHE